MNSLKEKQASRPKVSGRTFLVIVALTFLCYSFLLKDKIILRGNEAAHLGVVRSMVMDGSIECKGGDIAIYKGKTYSNKPPGLPFAVVVPYFLFYHLCTSDRFAAILFLHAISALIAAVCVGLVYVLAVQLGHSQRGAIWAATSTGFATMLLAYGTLFISESPSALLVLLAVWLSLSWKDKQKKWQTGLAGFVISYSFLLHYANLFACIPLIVFLTLTALRARLWTHLTHFAFFSLTPLVALSIYQYSAFGSPFALTYGYSVRHWHYGILYNFSGLCIAGLYGLTLSASRGMFLLSPVLLFALFGIYYCRRDFRGGHALPLSCVLSMLLLISLYRYWHGGHPVGYRHMLNVVPCLAMFIAPAYDQLGRNGRRVFYSVFAFSVFASIFGFLIQDSPTNLLTWLQEPNDVHAKFYTELIPHYVRNVLKTGLHGKYFNINDYTRHCLLAVKIAIIALYAVAGGILLVRTRFKRRKRNANRAPTPEE